MLKMVERMKWRRRGSMVAMWCSCDRWVAVKWSLMCSLIDLVRYICMYDSSVG
jgi:hypothetical protein